MIDATHSDQFPQIRTGTETPSDRYFNECCDRCSNLERVLFVEFTVTRPDGEIVDFGGVKLCVECRKSGFNQFREDS